MFLCCTVNVIVTSRQAFHFLKNLYMMSERDIEKIFYWKIRNIWNPKRMVNIYLIFRSL